MPGSHDTIYALSSGRPPAAIAVIRISGPRAGDALKALTGRIPEPRKAQLARPRDPQSGEIIDEALGLWFPGPNSETGEDTAELQLHGGRAVIAATLAALGAIDGLRPAEAGEFTRRAFENGKLDLTAVEGLADLVSAETEGQRRQAFRQMKGLLGDRAEGWRQRLIRALALVEARIDFSDEADVPEDLVSPALAIARDLADEIEAALADGGRGERLREGLVVAIAGPPNAGKSTLLNRIAQREAAIVSPYAGTTRDVIEVHLDLGGLPVTLLDTAGIRDTDDPVEREGVRRARDRAAAADLVLWVEDASDPAGGAVADIPGSPSPGQPMGALKPIGGTAELAAAAGASRFPVEARQRGDLPGEAPEPPDPLEVVASTEAFVARAPAGAFAPMMWRILNKIDLKDCSDKSEEKIKTNLKNESQNLSYNPLSTKLKDPLIDKNEQLERTNPQLTNVVNERLTGRSEFATAGVETTFDLSATTGQGFAPLLTALSEYAAAFLTGAESALISRARHRRELADTAAAMRRALSPRLSGHEDLVAEELRIAGRALGRLTGRVDVEDILDVIFRDFCIGK
ncbi:MAG: tRNA uridine-5-carboxymethylaminomethyl(34) synthesis GTPase MnmE [Pseudolabrys sp.]|nr:tRNA uridine-5-carboxymethylaminomethyl(34) synthesis GTPase MnmE [Pseudolabrys sp.]